MSRARTLAAIRQHYRLGGELADVVRLARHGRASLAALYGLLGFQSGAELGVWDGQHAEWLCQYNPGLRLLGVDAWEDFAYGSGHPDPLAFVQVRQRAERRLAKYPGVTLRRGFTSAVAETVEDGSLDFIFVDASHALVDVLADLRAWAPKVRAGGIVSGHDYETTVMGWPPENGVKAAVHTYLDQHPAHGPLFLLMGTARDRWKSYFWVQP